MEIGIKKNSANVCPKCGDEDIDYIGYEFDDLSYIFYKCVCRECNTEFTEVYSVEYDGYNLYDEETDEEHIFDADGDEL